MLPKHMRYQTALHPVNHKTILFYLVYYFLVSLTSINSYLIIKEILTFQRKSFPILPVDQRSTDRRPEGDWSRSDPIDGVAKGNSSLPAIRVWSGWRTMIFRRKIIKTRSMESPKAIHPKRLSLGPTGLEPMTYCL
jgi:hypothetical protein